MPENEPPVQVAVFWKVRSVPAMVLPLNRNGEVSVPPFRVTMASAPTFSVLTRKVPSPWIVALSRVWVPFLNSSVAPAARLHTPVAPVALLPCISIVPALTFVVPVLR